MRYDVRGAKVEHPVSNRRKKTNRARKMRQLRMKFTFLIMTSIFLVVFGASLCSVNAKANSADGADDYKYYANYCIEPGDTLWSIATENMDYSHYDNVKEYAKEIQKINKIHTEHITNGTYIMIPYFDNK